MRSAMQQTGALLATTTSHLYRFESELPKSVGVVKQPVSRYRFCFVQPQPTRIHMACERSGDVVACPRHVSGVNLDRQIKVSCSSHERVK